jgi:hypothetical protein
MCHTCCGENGYSRGEVCNVTAEAWRHADDSVLKPVHLRIRNPDMKYASVPRTMFALALLSCSLILASCDEKKEQVIVEPPMDGTRLGAWRIDTLPRPGTEGGLRLFCMLVIDTNHIVVGGHAIGPPRKLIEFKGDSIIYWEVSSGVYNLAPADEGFYSCENNFPGAVTHNLNGEKTDYLSNRRHRRENVWSMYRRADGTYFVGFIRARHLSASMALDIREGYGDRED